jgi:hypothetical protein
MLNGVLGARKVDVRIGISPSSVILTRDCFKGFVELILQPGELLS